MRTKPYPEINLDLPENPSASHCLRQQELVNRIHVWQGHSEQCECRSCIWVREQLMMYPAEARE